MDLLISAAPFEIEPFLAATSLTKNFPLPDWISCGIGALNASEAAESIAKRAAGKRVVFVGTAGVFGSFTQPVAYRIERVIWLPTSDRLQSSYCIDGLYPDLLIPLNQEVTGSGPVPALCLCGPSISLEGDTNGFIERLTPGGMAVLENLELYSIVRRLSGVCKTLDCILVSTNEVGPNAHEQWRANFKAASALTAQLLSDLYLSNSKREKGGEKSDGV